LETGAERNTSAAKPHCKKEGKGRREVEEEM
jgi:hypothetical protein